MAVTPATVRTASWKSAFLAFGVAAPVALVATSLIAVAARGLLDAPPSFQPLTPAAYGTWTVIGTLAGAIGWRLLAARRAGAGRLLTRLVPVVLAVSLIPDLALLANQNAVPGTTTAAVLALMLMHLAVAAIAVPAYRRFMPPQS